MTDLVEVAVQVPPDRIADLYAAVAQLLRPKADGPAPQAEAQEELLEWHQGDEAKAKQVLTRCSTMAQRILRYLASHPDQPLLGDDIAQELGLAYGRQGVAGSLSSVGINCSKVGRHMPFHLSYSPGASAGHYIMPREVADMFRGT